MGRILFSFVLVFGLVGSAVLIIKLLPRRVTVGQLFVLTTIAAVILGLASYAIRIFSSSAQ